MWEVGLPPPSCGVFLPLPLLQDFLLLVAGRVPPLLPSPASLFIYSSHGKWAFPPSCGVVLPPPLLQAFLLLVAGHVPLLLPSLAGLFIYSSVRDCPFPPLEHSGQPAIFIMCLFCYCLLFSFSFFPGLGSVCPEGYADLAQDYLWEYCMLLSSPCGLHLPKWSGRWHLAVREPSWCLHLM
jgi:hypothetical protein